MWNRLPSDGSPAAAATPSGALLLLLLLLLLMLLLLLLLLMLLLLLLLLNIIRAFWISHVGLLAGISCFQRQVSSDLLQWRSWGVRTHKSDKITTSILPM